MVNNLTVRIIGAKNLIAADKGGTSDPYVKLRVGTTTYKTKVIKKCLNPKWEETFRFKVANPKTSKLVIDVFDKDKWTKDDPLGSLSIPLTKLEQGVETENWLNLTGVKSGQINIALTAVDFGLPPGSSSMASQGNVSAFQSNYGPGQQYPGSGQRAGAGGYPGSQPAGGYPGSQPAGGYPGAQPAGGYPGAQGGYPGSQPAGGYPGSQPAGGYPGAQPAGGYPGAQGGYTGAQGGYPGAQQNTYASSQPTGGYPGAQQNTYASSQPTGGYPGAQNNTYQPQQGYGQPAQQNYGAQQSSNVPSYVSGKF